MGYIQGMKRSITGFTIVELLIVIIVIAILAAVSVVAYTGIQNRANDSRIRAGVKQLETALRVYAQDHSLPIRGGSGSSVAVSNGECSDGLSGFLGSGVYTCSVEDALISAGVLQGSLTQTLPANTYHGNDADGRRSIMLYTCGGSSSTRYSLFWTLRNPSAEDTASIDSVFATCGHNVQIRDTWGMRAGKIIQF